MAPEVARGLMCESDEPSFYRLVAAEPGHWLEFAKRIRSPEIFKEALIHAAGRVNTPAMSSMRYDMEERTRDIVNAKLDELKDLQTRLILNINSWYPEELKRQAEPGFADVANIGRGSYSNDISGWQALALFKQYIVQEAITEFYNQDLGYAFLEKLSKGGNSYLTKEDMQPWFHSGFPMTAKGEDVIERWVNEFKNHVKGWASVFMVNKSEVNIGYIPLGFFTCIDASEEDLPFAPVRY